MIDEKTLIKQLSDSSQKEAAFTRLVREYQEPLYWQIRRMVLVHDDADDVLQNTFIKAWSAIDSFRGESRLQTWLFRIAINESLNFLSKKKQVLSLDQPFRLPATATSTGTNCSNNSRRQSAHCPKNSDSSLTSSTSTK